MPFLYVVEYGSTIRKAGDELVVDKEGEILLRTELADLVSVVILPSVQVTSQALAAILAAGTELAIISTDGKLLGQLTPPLARNQEIRKAQFARESDEGFALCQSQAVVRAKLHNQREVLRRFTALEKGEQPQVEQAVSRIDAACAKAEGCESSAQLMGIEGAAAAAYWSAFGEMLKPEDMPFTQRHMHPSPDPVNAMLSFGYTLLTNGFTSLLDAVGFDPFIGFMHQETYGHPSLALDLVEPFRAPVIDRMVIRIINLRMVDSEDFVPHEDGGLRMSDEAIRVYFREYERALETLKVREAMRAQVQDLARVFRGDQELLTPWLWKAQ